MKIARFMCSFPVISYQYMSCPYKAPTAEEQPASTGKCPYSAAKSESAPAQGKCPYSAAKEEQPKSTGKCPYSNRAQSNENAPTDLNAVRPYPFAGHIPYGSAEGAADWSKATGDEFKKHFQDSYDRVAANAEATSKPTEARMARARKIALKCGYTDAELDVIGNDVWMLQGTGNPHKAANVQAGETVVDLGSGFGIDATVAASKAGETGRVIGVDLSIREIGNALMRVHARGLRNLDFRYGDIEQPPVTSNSADVVMSNGGFCLVPNKRKAFAEIFRMLRPGVGRLSVSCTVRLQELEKDKKWPSCFLVFMPMVDVVPVLTECGFVDISIERCPTEEKEEKKEEEKPAEEGAAKVTVHSTGNPEYAFLKDYNMAELFACVNIYARKP